MTAIEDAPEEAERRAFKRKQRSWAFRLLRAVVIGYIAVCALIFFFQKRILYHPTIHDPRDLAAFYDRHGFDAWPDLDDPRLLFGSGPALDPGPTILYLHGNGGAATGQGSMIARFRPLKGRVYLYEFPGYGARGGEISETSLTTDLARTIDMICAERPGPLILVGSSLGTAVICGALRHTEKKVAAIVLFTPFTTLADAASEIYWYLPARLLVKEVYDNVAGLEHFDGSLAVFTAEHDRTTPVHLGKRLFDSYDGPKRYQMIAGADHGSWYERMSEEQWHELNDWLMTEVGLPLKEK